MRAFQRLRAGLRQVTPRRVAAGVAASGGVVVAQGVYLLHVYVPMPPPGGDTFGFERWNGAGAAHRSQPAGGEPAGAAHRPGDADEGSASIASGGPPRRRTRNVLIIGDSLVVGIGCKDRMVLPQGICRQMSDLLQVDISWRAVGVNGGDVRTIKQEVLETVKRFQSERELRYQEYLASLDAAPSAQARAPLPAGEALPQAAAHATANGPGASTGLPSVAASPSAAKRQQLLHQHLDAGVPQQTPPHLRGAGAALFDFVCTHPSVAPARLRYLKRTEHAGAGSGDTLNAYGDVARDAGRSHSVLVSEPSPKVDAVIVLCGLNDLKRILRGRTSTDFHDDLDRLVTEVRAQVGQECMVILPAMPMEQTRLPQPLRSAAVQLSHYYDLQKEKIATQMPLTHFIRKPAMEIWHRAKERYGEIVAQDGVHPNESGYKVFAEFLGQEIAELLRPQPLTRTASPASPALLVAPSRASSS